MQNYQSIILLSTTLLWGCSSTAITQPQADATKQPSKIEKPKHSNVQEKQLVVRLCAPESAEKAKAALKQKQFVLLKQASPTLWALGWKDQRTIQEAKQDLAGDMAIFCHIQENHQYKATF